MTKEYITKRLNEGATVEEIAAEFSATLNEVQKEQEEKNAQLKDLRAIADQFINYLDLYYHEEIKHLTDEELVKLRDIIPSLIKLAKSMEKLNSFTIETLETIGGDNDPIITTLKYPKNDKSESIISKYVNELLGL